MRIFGQFMLSMLLGLGVFGCVTAQQGTEDGAILVERSKELPPAWVELASGRLHETQAVFQYVEVRTRLLNLPVGLKQTQLGALAASEHELRDHVRSRIFNYARDNDIPMVGPMAELDQLLQEAVRQVHGDHARIADIYFERYRLERVSVGEFSEYYKARVLVQLPKEQYPAFMAEVGRRLVAARDPQLKRLGRVIGKIPTQDLSH